jgi:hypothetical protein
MKKQEIIDQINNLPEHEWDRMKKHMDAKFPSMAMPNMDLFKEMVKMYGMFDKEKLN